MAKFELTFDPALLNMQSFPAPKAKTKYKPQELAELADIYYKLKEQRLALQKAVEELQRQSGAYFQILLQAMDPDELSSVSGAAGEALASWVEDIKFNDAAAFEKWAARNREKYPLYKEAVDKAVVLSLLQSPKPPKVPGVELYKFKQLKVLKAKVAKAKK